MPGARFVPLLAVAAVLPILPGRAAAEERRSFDELSAAATPAPDLAALAGPFTQDCRKGRREIDRARCRGMGGFLTEKLAGRLFTATVDGAGAVLLSDYDARVRGLVLRVAGCLACERPVQPPLGDPTFVTVKGPEGGGPLPEAVVAGQGSVSFETPEEARQWKETVAPRLRTELLFRAAGRPWTRGEAKGVAFSFVGARVWDPCTAKVFFSEPASGTPSGLAPDQAACQHAVAGEAEGDGGRAGTFSVEALNGALGAVRPAFETCDRQFATAGTAYLDFVVDGQRGLQSVSLAGRFAGTALGDCLLEAARTTEFPRFQGKAQRFRYPVVLRGQRR